MLHPNATSHLEDTLACRTRCVTTRGCAHFSYELDGKLCTLHEGRANPTMAEDTIAGATQCPWCSTVNVGYRPLLPGHGATRESDAEACQQRCAVTPECARFTYALKGTVCMLHDHHAWEEHFADVVSGPPVCVSARYAADSMVDLSAVGVGASSVSGISASSAAAPQWVWLLLIVLLTLLIGLTTLAWAVLCRRRRTSRAVERLGSAESRYKAMTELLATGHFAAGAVQ
eukprot:NODE_13997_length_1134_cov_7.302880.p1 GENE.NODE_13997_length_1134_cov_7.302880~~NODE_13997_length_1134_cov_7.302880.p1  ORF type:complete len:230 (+),score=43.53 NODE_13997_length_1134_cov_7.302880:146-835(+)